MKSGSRIVGRAEAERGSRKGPGSAGRASNASAGASSSKRSKRGAFEHAADSRVPQRDRDQIAGFEAHEGRLLQTLKAPHADARVALLEKRVQLLSDELSVALDRISVDNGRPAKASRIPRRVKFDADSLSQFAVGFFQREYDSEGVPIRWTGAGPFCELRVFIDRTVDCQFSIDVGDTDEAILGAMTSYVDYAPTALSIGRGDRGYLVKGIIPRRSFTRLAVITIVLGKDESAEGTLDEQWLGFRFYSMNIWPEHESE